MRCGGRPVDGRGQDTVVAVGAGGGEEHGVLDVPEQVSGVGGGDVVGYHGGAGGVEFVGAEGEPRDLGEQPP